MYLFRDMEAPTGEAVRHIFFPNNGGYITFPDVEWNDGPERAAYLAWLAEGNTAEEVESPIVP